MSICDGSASKPVSDPAEYDRIAFFFARYRAGWLFVMPSILAKYGGGAPKPSESAELVNPAAVNSETVVVFHGP